MLTESKDNDIEKTNDSYTREVKSIFKPSNFGLISHLFFQLSYYGLDLLMINFMLNILKFEIYKPKSYYSKLKFWYIQ